MRRAAVALICDHSIKKPTSLQRWHLSRFSLTIATPLVGLLVHQASSAQMPAPALPLVLPSLSPVLVTAPRNPAQPSLSVSPLGAGQSWQFDADDLQGTAGSSIDNFLSRRGIASTDAASSLGIAPGLGLRGFAVNAQATPGLTASRLYLNGHADIAYRFVRDLSTVESVEVIGGFDATLLGVGAPGGTLQFFSKQARGEEANSLSLTAASDGLLRTTIDIEKHLGAVQMRAVVTAQTGQRTAEKAPTNRENYLFSFTLPSALGEFKFDAERQANRAPFVFGTIYANGRFEYDKPYVSPQSQALRVYERQAFYWSKQISSTTQISSSAQLAQVNRRETLVGFWDIKDATQLNGYWRELDASATQKDLDLRLDTTAALFGHKHQLTAAIQQHQQTLDFSGPQSISQFSISIANPVWPVNLSTLTLKPRTLRENYRETGLALTDRIELPSGLELRLGVRQSAVGITTASNTPTPKSAAQFSHNTYAAALAWQLTPAHKAWLSRTTSFEPNRGQLRSGDFLPPQTGRQIEAGWAYSNLGQRWSATMFNISQTNLPNTDPLDKNYIVPAGTAQVSGLVLSAGLKFSGIQFDINTTYQRGNARDLASPAQGNLLVGQPQWFGGARIEGAISQATSWWVNPQWRGQRPADALGMLYAPAFIRFDVGLLHKLSAASTLAVQIDNLADKRYVQAISSDDNVWQGPRRRLSIQLTQAF